MYLSNLLIDVGNNPDRPRPGRTWLRNIYHVHQRLCMAFPSAERKKDDPQFLKPYAPDDFPEDRHQAEKTVAEAGPEALKHVHAQRDSERGFLFRIDPLPGASAAIIVLSAVKPDWDYAFQNAAMFLAAKPEVREYCPAFVAGQELRFRIRINLSKKSAEHRGQAKEGEGAGRARTQGKRVALTWSEEQRPEDVIVPWFAARGARSGFDLGKCEVVQVGWVGGYRPERDKGLKFRSALLEGTLRVTDPARFLAVIASGMGSAKAFGFGLLSVAPCERET